MKIARAPRTRNRIDNAALEAALDLARREPLAYQISQQYLFVNGTTADATQMNTDLGTLFSWANGGVDHSNVNQSVGFYASDLMGSTVAANTFGGTAGYTHLAPSASTVPLTVAGATSQTANLFNVATTSGGSPTFWIDSAGAAHFSVQPYPPNGGQWVDTSSVAQTKTGGFVAGPIGASGSTISTVTVGSGFGVGTSGTATDYALSWGTTLTGTYRIASIGADATAVFHGVPGSVAWIRQVGSGNGVTIDGSGNIGASGVLYSAGVEALGGGINASALTTLSSPGTDAGDLLAQRSASTGALFLGGATNYGTLDYGVNNATAFTFNSPLHVLGAVTITGALNTGAVTITGALNTNGLGLFGGLGTADAGVLEVSALTSYSAVTGQQYGDGIFQRTASTGAVSLGGASGAGTLDYGATFAGQFTANKPLGVNGAVTIGGQGTASLGQLKVTALSSPSAASGQTSGDGIFQRTAATGAVLLGGATSSSAILWDGTNTNITASTATGALISANSAGYAPIFAGTNSSNGAYCPPLYNASGNQIGATTHMVTGAGSATFSSSQNASTTITLSGAAVFNNLGTYSVYVSPTTQGIVGGFAGTNGSQFTVYLYNPSGPISGSVSFNYLAVGY